MLNKKNKKIVRVGSRESALAVAQAKIVMDAISRAHPEIELTLVPMKTQGDRISDAQPNAPLPSSKKGVKSAKDIVKGLFVKELESALIEGRIDFAVHSLKDMSVVPNEALPIVALSPREVPYDVAVFRKDFKNFRDRGIFEVSELAGLRGGCSSARRRVQLQCAVACEVRPIRGNIVTRLAKLDQGDAYDFLVLAAAGLLRLGMKERIGYCFSDDLILPAPGQGVLACQGRAGENYDYLSCFHDQEVAICVTAERAFAAATGGGCSSPVAAHARVIQGLLRLEAFFAEEGAERGVRGDISGDIGEAKELGEALAARLLK